MRTPRDHLSGHSRCARELLHHLAGLLTEHRGNGAPAAIPALCPACGRRYWRWCGSAALYWAADELDLPTVADAGYHGTGPGIYTPVKLPNTGGGHLTTDHQTYNQLLRRLRAPGERAFDLLTRRWKALRHTTASPSRIGDVVRSALALTHYERRYTTC